MQNYLSTVSPARLAVVLALLGGCQDPYEPNWLFRGQWIDIDGRDREADETCAGTFEYLDRYAGAVAIEFGLNERLAPYRWYSPEQYDAEEPCGERHPYACAWYDGLETPLMPHEHEVVHLANFAAGICPNALSEGLADYYNTLGRTPGSNGLELLTARLRDPSAGIPHDEYPILARFAAYLVERFGLDQILEVCTLVGRYPTGDELATAMASVFGITNDALLADFAEQPGWCNSFEVYQSRVYACGVAEAAPNAGVAGIPGEVFEATYEFGCANESTVGPLGGEIWITQRIDIAADATYDVALRDGPSAGDIPDVELILAKCEPCGRVHSFGPGEFIGPEQYEAGRYWLEIRAPEDFRGTLTLTIKPLN